MARAHHGSVSKEQRARIEEALKRGGSPASWRPRASSSASTWARSTSSSRSSLAAVGGQRRCSAWAAPATRSARCRRGVLFPKHRGDLLADRRVRRADARRRRSRRCACPANPLDVLAQQIVAALRRRHLGRRRPVRTWSRRAAPFQGLPRSAYDATLDLLAGPLPQRRVRRAAPAHRLGPRRRHARPAGPGAQRLAVTSRRHHPRPRPVTASSWSARSGSRGRRARRGDGLRVPRGRRLLARRHQLADRGHHPRPGAGLPRPRPARAAAVLEGRPARPPRRARPGDRRLHPRARRADRAEAGARCHAAGLDDWAAGNLLAFLDEQQAATRVVPDDRTLLVERFRDELGDWRMVLHSPYGAQVHAPWALAVGAPAARSAYGFDAQALASDDGIVVRVPDLDARAARRRPVRLRPRRDRGPGHRPRSAGRRCSPPGSASARPAPCCCPAATPAGAARCGSSASGRRSCSRSQSGTRRSRWSWSRCASACRTSTTCPRWSSSCRAIAARAVRIVEVDTAAAVAVRRSLLFGYVARLHLRRRHPARRAAGRRAVPRPRPARRAARPGRAARAASTPRRWPSWRPSCNVWPRPAQPATPRALADLLRLLGPLDAAETARRTQDGLDAGAAGSTDAGGARRADRGAHRPARSAGPRSRTPAGCATPSACRSRPAPPERSPSRSTTRSATWSAATPAPTGRSPSADVAARFGLGSAVVARHAAPARRPGAGGRGRVPPRAARARSGATPRCCARLRRRSLAAAAPRGRAGRARGARPGSCRPGRGSGRPCAASTGCCRSSSSSPAARCPPRPSSRWCSAARVARLRARHARRAHRRRRGALGRPRGRCRATTAGSVCYTCRHRPADPAAPRAEPSRRRCAAKCSTGSPTAARWFFPQLAEHVCPTETNAARRRRAVGAGLGRPGHQRHPRPAALARLAAARPPTGPGRTPPRIAAHAAAAPPRRARSAHSAGRPLVAAAPGRADPTRRATAAAERSARPARRRHPRRRRRRAGPRRLRGASTACSRPSRSPAAAAAATSSRASAPPSSPSRVRSTGCAPRRAPAPVPARRPPTRPTPTAPPSPGPPRRRSACPSGHRPGRKAGALVVLVEGALVLYVERGGRTLLDLHRRRCGAGRRARRDRPPRCGRGAWVR